MVLNETDCLTEPNGFLSKYMAILKSQNILRQRTNQIYAKDTDESGPNPLYTDMSLGASLLAVDQFLPRRSTICKSVTNFGRSCNNVSIQKTGSKKQ
jgi:hypothetical protein